MHVRNGFGHSRSAFLPLALIAALAVEAADWPTYRANNTRSGATTNGLSFPLKQIWSHQSPQPPRPAWPPPARGSIWQRLERIEPRVVDDRVFHPVAAGERVYYASSSDDQVYCLDAATGEIAWRFFADAPVRYAPTGAGDAVLFGSDDGFVYSVSGRDGSLQWRRRVGPIDRRIPGNGRLISIWPIRSSVLVQEGVAYCFAGLFPSQGVFAAAYRLSDGAIVYERQIEPSPQGYVLSAAGELYVPTGRSNPIAVDPKTGEVLRSFDGVGGTFALVVDNELVAGPGNDGSLAVSHRTSRASLVQFSGRQMVVAAGVSYLLSNDELLALDRTRFLALTAQRRDAGARQSDTRSRLQKAGTGGDQVKTLQDELAALSEQIKQLDLQLGACYLWRVPVQKCEALILAGGHLVVGGEDRVLAFETRTGKGAWEATVRGKALGLAVADGRLFATTDTGELHCFTGGDAPARPQALSSATAPQPGADEPTGPAAITEIISRIAQTAAARKGYALLLGSENLTLAKSLVRRTDLKVALVLRDAAKVDALRRELADTALYGSRISVHRIEAETLPFTDHFANLVIDEGVFGKSRSAAWPELEMKRVLRPFGSLAWSRGQRQPVVSPPLEGAGQWTHLYANAANTASTEDARIKPHLALQWFGGPGPRPMIDRHLRGPAPLVANGRMFVIGENRLLSVDAFNGTELWDIELPNSRRYSLPYDSGSVAADERSVYVAVEDRLWIIDGATGEARQRLALPPHGEPGKRHWGYVAAVDGVLFGTGQRVAASRREPTYDAIDEAYWSRQPIVTSEFIFCLDRQRDRPAWIYTAGAILNPTITITDGRVYFFESRNEKARTHTTGRINLRELTESGFYLVSLDAATGRRIWDKAMDLRRCENILYLAAAKGALVVVGSGLSPQSDAEYHVRVLEATTGEVRWQATHDNGKPGALGHGEQVHHPVVLGRVLVAEPVMYDLETGRPYNPEGKAEHWRIMRPGHSCGTMSGAGASLFFRANNPTLLNIDDTKSIPARFTALAPTRPGCWINIIPANGLVLIPEASAGCVCHYPLQTSMAFLPVDKPLVPAVGEPQPAAR
ncbi:MAG: PQQ-binding-like beta-propeller repeat protein [Verrucomicrobia bacterium]|nr:PQQ-binding-like beta-propeller repeat protein [Verrucomicrobiota bacterium]